MKKIFSMVCLLAFLTANLIHSMENQQREAYSWLAKALIQSRANVNHIIKKGRTPLHFAVLTGDRELVQELLNAGAITDAADQWGETPLHLASVNGYGDIVDELIRQGANPQS